MKKQLRIASLQLDDDVLFDLVQQVAWGRRMGDRRTSISSDTKRLRPGDRVIELGRESAFSACERGKVGAEQPRYGSTTGADTYPLTEYIELIAE